MSHNIENAMCKMYEQGNSSPPDFFFARRFNFQRLRNDGRHLNVLWNCCTKFPGAQNTHTNTKLMAITFMFCDMKGLT